MGLAVARWDAGSLNCEARNRAKAGRQVPLEAAYFLTPQPRATPTGTALSYGGWVLAAVLGAPVAPKTPCEDVILQLSKEQQESWSKAIAEQLAVPSVDVLPKFGSGRWRLVYADTHQSDEVFLFYSNIPTSQKYQSIWSGAAERSETKAMEAWALQNVPGVPKELASCFAWYVTLGR